MKCTPIPFRFLGGLALAFALPITLLGEESPSNGALRASAGATSPNPGLQYYYPLPGFPAARTSKVDVCVYGGTPGGVAAAIQAKRMCKTTMLAVFRRHVGGLTSAGLTAVDLGSKESLGGLAVEFLNRMGRWRDFRPGDAEIQFRAMLDENEVPVAFEHRLKAVEKAGNRIVALEFENGHRVEAKCFIDATYEGDLLAHAGVSYHVGREANAVYEEAFNGYFIADKHQFRFPVDPYRIPGDPASGLLPGIEPGVAAERGSGDKRVQAFNFRMWAAETPNAIPWPKPANYNRDDYALLLRYLASAPDGFVWDWRYKPSQAARETLPPDMAAKLENRYHPRSHTHQFQSPPLSERPCHPSVT